MIKKRLKIYLILFMILVVYASAAYAAVTLTALTTGTYGFISNAYSADWSSCETVRAAVTGKSIYIERIYINAHDAETITFGAGESGHDVTATLLGPISAPADTIIDMIFARPIKVTAATALVADAASSGNVTIIVQGFVK